MLCFHRCRITQLRGKLTSINSRVSPGCVCKPKGDLCLQKATNEMAQEPIVKGRIYADGRSGGKRGIYWQLWWANNNSSMTTIMEDDLWCYIQFYNSSCKYIITYFTGVLLYEKKKENLFSLLYLQMFL